MSSLFGHLAPRFSSQPENVATEALNYILRGSESARSAFVQHLDRRTGPVEMAPALQFSTQRQSEDGGVPDLWGQAHDQRVLVEVKFWAGLTDRQSEAYRSSLAEAGSGACVFLVPEERIGNVRRKVGTLFNDDAKENFAVAVTSWNQVLNGLESAVRDSDEKRRSQWIGDLEQLRGLCERLKAEGFRPIQPGELGPDVARRHLDLRKLVDELYESLRTEGFNPWTVTGDMRRRTSIYRFEAELYGTTSFVGIMFNLWKDLEDSPLWFKFKERDSSRRQALKNALRGNITVLDHPRKNEDILVPLELKREVARDHVVTSLKDQLRAIPEALSESGIEG